MLTHLCSHAETVIAHMAQKDRNVAMSIRVPMISYEKTMGGKKGFMFYCCLHCKKGMLSCSERKKRIVHDNCIASFYMYESLYVTASETIPVTLPDWKPIAKDKYVKVTGKELVLTKPVPVIQPVIESAPVEPVVTEVKTVETVADMPQHLVDRIMEWWMIGREPDQEVEEDEVTIHDKLKKMLDTFDKQNSKVILANNIKMRLQARVSTLEGILEDNNIQF